LNNSGALRARPRRRAPGCDAAHRPRRRRVCPAPATHASGSEPRAAPSPGFTHTEGPRSQPSSSRRAPTGRRTPNGPPVRSVPFPAVHSSRGQLVPLDAAVGTMWSLACSLATLKKGVPSSRAGRAAVKPPPAPLAGRRGELPAGPARHQTSLSSTVLGTCDSPQTCRPSAEPPHRAGPAAPAAATAGDRRAPHRRSPSPSNPVQIKP
jgi:hypothetical protein